MITIIAEKPSVAREIAALLGASEKKDGYISGNGYFVTWAFGHLVGLGMPEDYGISGFIKTALPIFPNPFLLTVRKIKGKKNFIPDMGAVKQLTVIDKLIGQSEKIIAATDAGREGELIFRYIYHYLKCTKPFERLWISSLTEKAIKKGIANLKPGSDFNGLFHAAQARSRADWLVGINASQALSIAAGDGIYSLGRVQTPTLALICRRFLENKHFSVQQYWQIELSHTKEFIEFKSRSRCKWEDKKLAEDALRSINRNAKAAFVTFMESKTVCEQPPLLFDLTGLQKEANIKLNLSAEETLNIAQSLYEKKFITYPRTGSKYIPEDMWREIPSIVRAMQDSETFSPAVAKVKYGHFNKRIINNLRVTDHHGLLTTEKIPSALTAKENAVYNMIAFRVLEAISQPCIKELTNGIVQVLHYDLALKGSKIIESGWRSIKGDFSDDSEAVQELPELKEGTEVKVKNTALLEMKTRPPVLYTEAALLAAMENAGRAIQNEEQSKAIQHTGIGTPATRAAVIEALFARNYIKRDRKSLIPTEKGLNVFELVKDRKIADAAMTAQWELAFRSIENNESDAETFQKEIEIYTATITKELLQTSIKKSNVPELVCPKCRDSVLLIRDSIIKCPDDACKWVQYRNFCGVHIEMSDIESLLGNGRSSLIRGLQSRAGKKFDAFIVLNDKAETVFEFRNKKP